jgi:hypothetical protein
MMCLRELPISTHSLPGLIVSASVASSLSRRASGRSTRRSGCVPSLIVPAVGCELAEDQLEQRRLAAPLGPISPILSPRMTVVVKLSTIVRSP